VNAFAWLYAQWIGIPVQLREPMKRAVVSFALSVVNISYGLAVAFQILAQKTNQPMTFSNFVAFVNSAWFAYLLGFVIAAGRAQQGYQAAVNPQTAVPVPTPPATTMVVEKSNT